MMRLDKFLSDCGAGTRKELKSLIKNGRVSVNGEVICIPEYKVNQDSDNIRLDGITVRYARYHYYMLNKPSGVLSATEDRRQRTVIDLLPPDIQRLGLFPVGRLDKDTEGLLLLTDDGEFAHIVMSPKSCISKIYYAETEYPLEDNDIAKFRDGIMLKDGTKCLPAELEIVSSNSCRLTVMEGKYHQVKRMLASVGKPVTYLKRIRIGGLDLDADLKPGDFRELSDTELCKVYAEHI